MAGKFYNEVFSLKDEGGMFLRILVLTCLITTQCNVTIQNIKPEHVSIFDMGFLFCIHDLHTIMPVFRI
jgi:hypothetical protein